MPILMRQSHLVRHQELKSTVTRLMAGRCQKFINQCERKQKNVATKSLSSEMLSEHPLKNKNKEM